MRCRVFSGRRLLFASALLLLSAAAHAEVRYIASTGDDANPCTRAAAPCRTLQHGIDMTPDGGELRVLDSGAYGTGTIAKSLTVSADGATVIAGIVIDSAAATVALRGLDLNGSGASQTAGIEIIAALAVHVERCEIERYVYEGIYATAREAEIFVTDSVFRDNGGAGLTYYDEQATIDDYGPSILHVENSRFENNGTDGVLRDGGTSFFTGAIFSGNGAHGIALGYGEIHMMSSAAVQNRTHGFSFQRARSTVEASIAQGNGSGFSGLYAAGSDPALFSLVVSNSVIVNNKSNGIRILEVTARTRGNNTVVNNPTNVNGTFTPLAGR